ncbi:hypothetical protein DWG18_02455 [Lysobacter sp. TY2-98]|uniref:hypothetical protein n=1 Tax=Lysobacter sp. TY2-98 TaxID=2290922 RepID=UPI000E200896|nr:hypothetical protein [Lysobacter sp. TY2-98]AXK71254.1 hypothetical protein DWG18_02415 [Lysobacter sp. TY2-98]AXK71261.1 hypothetical protein DWG18_02455 [Lysobacter sp. TY2-98]
MQQPSKFVTVVAWIFIVLSGFGTVISVLQNVMFQTMFRTPEFADAMQAPAPGMPPFASFMFGHFQVVLLAFLAVSALMLLSSIGLLRRWNWARLTFVGLMVLAVAWQIVGVVIQFSMFSSMRQQFAAAATQGTPDMGPFFVAIGVISVIFALTFGGLFSWIAAKLMSAPIAAEFRR